MFYYNTTTTTTTTATTTTTTKCYHRMEEYRVRVGVEMTGRGDLWHMKEEEEEQIVLRSAIIV